MSPAELKSFIKKVYDALQVMVNDGDITAEQRSDLGKVIVGCRLNKESLDI